MAAELDKATVNRARTHSASYEAGKERQRLAVASMEKRPEGDIVYFSPLGSETLEQALDRVNDDIETFTKGRKIVILAKVSGDYIRVRRLLDCGARGKLAEWKNLRFGQSDTVHEERGGAHEFDRARATAAYLARSGQGAFQVSIDQGAMIRIYRAHHPRPEEF